MLHYVYITYQSSSRSITTLVESCTRWPILRTTCCKIFYESCISKQHHSGVCVVSISGQLCWSTITSFVFTFIYYRFLL